MISDHKLYRLYEILPGLSIWFTLLSALILSFVKPLWMIYFIIIFDIYWCLRVTNFSFYLVVAWFRFRKTMKQDWTDKLKREVVGWQDKKHLVFLTLYNEDYEIVETTIEGIKESAYKKENFIIIVAGEERKEQHCTEVYEKIKQEFNKDFHDILFTLHPGDLEGEIPGKGSNLNYSEQQVKKYVDKKGWSYENLITTMFDIDTICHPDYFAYLTYQYCTHPNPTRSSYQPIALYNNNMWESPPSLRLMAFGTTFWLMRALTRQDSMTTFSSHSMSFKALVDVGFHDETIVSEDSRIFFQCWLEYGGDYEVTQMYLPVSMDTVRSSSWWSSVKNLYKQQRRWAYGLEHVPFLLYKFTKGAKNISIFKKIKWVFVEWEGKWNWAVSALLITILGRLPLWVAPESVRQSALYFNAPHILQNLMNFAMMGLLVSAAFSIPLLPQKPDSHPKYKYLFMLAQWALLPISIIFVSAFPAIDAATRIMLGKYLRFNVSEKSRVS
jgi:hypothetical protein